jgi:hypothetical protein
LPKNDAVFAAFGRGGFQREIEPSRMGGEFQQLFLAIYGTLYVKRLLEIFCFLIGIGTSIGCLAGIAGIVDERR